MNDEIAKKIGLLRHQIISPVLMQPERQQMAYFREIAKREFDFPGVGMKRIKASTMKTWFNLYRKFGFSALIPKTRADKGKVRKLSPECIKKIKQFREENHDLPATLFFKKCLENNILGEKHLCYSSLVRILKQEGMFKRRECRPRKKYEMDRFGELWVADFCHGPLVKDGRRFRKAILFGIIDDFSRLIVGASFAFSESTVEIEQVFKDSILKYGICDRFYTDNGPSFSSSYLAYVCAQCGIGLIHSKPYDSPSRGKIERFWRTVRERFLVDIKDKVLTLDELNEKLQKWLKDDYNFKKHSSIQVRPIDRYKESTEKYPLKRISKEELDEYFMSKITRDVRKDATVRIGGIYYEVPASYIGMKDVEIKRIQDENAYYLYEGSRRIVQLKPVDSRANAKCYTPTPRDNIINFHEGV